MRDDGGMTEQQSDPIVRDAPESNRYEALRGDDLVGRLDYVVDGPRVDLTHTWTDPAVRGQGVAGKLVQRALDDAREAGFQVVPTCSYVRSWINDHEEYADLVAGQ